MSFTLHHFRKEVRYLWWRWLAFLALLGFDLAVNLEWLLPIRAGKPSPQWLEYLPVVVLLAGLSLLLSCPEDKPGSDRSFVSTRPLPWAAYWKARVLIWLLLIVLPAVLQNGLYLVLSGRPAADVLRGMGEKLWLAVAYSGWLLSALVLWRGKEIWKALLGVALMLVAASKLLDEAGAEWLRFYASHYQTPAGRAAGWTLFGLLSAGVTWKHLQQGIEFRSRFLLAGAAAILGLITARFWVFTGPEAIPQDEALVRSAAPQLKVDIDLATARYDNRFSFVAPWLSAEPEISTGKPGIHVDMRFQQSRAGQAGKTFADGEAALQFARSRFGFDSPGMQVYRCDSNLRDFFPPGALFLPCSGYQWVVAQNRSTNLATFANPLPASDEPLRITAEYQMDWYQRDLALDLPVVAGSQGVCVEARWQILRVARSGGPQPGALTIDLQVETRAHWDAQNGSAILLHSPQRQLVWLGPAKQTSLGGRASHTGWTRSQVELTWNNVFNYADTEETGVDAAKLRLIQLRSRFLGSSPYTWKSPDLLLADFPSTWGDRYRWDYSQALYGGRELKAFQERMATIQPLTPGSSEQEGRRYLYDLFSTASATNAVYTPAAHPAITAAFEPLGRYHLPLLLELPTGLWPGWSNRPPNCLLERFVTEDQRETVIDRAISQPVLANLVLEKGWAEAAKRLKPRLLGMPKLPSYSTAGLLLAWGDEESQEKLLKEAQYDINVHIAKELDKTPALRPQLETILRREFEKTLPLLSSEAHWAGPRVTQAAEFGSVEAFDICLRWLAMGGDLPSRSGILPHPDLLNADGSDFWEKRLPDYVRWPLFRKLKVSDFDYLPEKRAWRFRKP